MRVEAICSPSDMVPRLEFVDETAYCEYDFKLYAALGPCPIHLKDPETPPQCHEDYKFFTSDRKWYYQPWRLIQIPHQAYT